MQYHTIASEQDERLWQQLTALEGQRFETARGLAFSFRVKRGRKGEALGELQFDRKEKTVTRNTVLLAYERALTVQAAEGCVSGPKKLGVFGASYLYPIFLHLGICSASSVAKRKKILYNAENKQQEE